ncbi:MAG TPA: YggT family protein [Acidimicrobiales bacterium]|jgi:YggT family protein|nr:YggT family protein [Acidimicrobiales bacterium]
MIALLLCRLLQAYFLILIGRVVLSWFPISPGSGMASVFSVVYAITEPVLAPLRKVIPPIGMGGMGLDLSPIIVFMLVIILQNAVCARA